MQILMLNVLNPDLCLYSSTQSSLHALISIFRIGELLIENELLTLVIQVQNSVRDKRSSLTVSLDAYIRQKQESISVI